MRRGLVWVGLVCLVVGLGWCVNDRVSKIEFDFDFDFDFDLEKLIKNFGVFVEQN